MAGCEWGLLWLAPCRLGLPPLNQTRGRVAVRFQQRSHKGPRILRKVGQLPEDLRDHARAWLLVSTDPLDQRDVAATLIKCRHNNKYRHPHEQFQSEQVR